MAEDDFTLFPPATIIYMASDRTIEITFPSADDAIVFFEFMRSFIAGEIELEAHSK